MSQKIKHNLIIFQSSINGCFDKRKMTPYITSVSEATYNLAAQLIKEKNFSKALDSLKDIEYDTIFGKSFTLNAFLSLRGLQENKNELTDELICHRLEKSVEISGGESRIDGLASAAALDWAKCDYLSAMKKFDILMQKRPDLEELKINWIKSAYLEGEFADAYELLKTLKVKSLNERPDLLQVYLRSSVLLYNVDEAMDFVKEKMEISNNDTVMSILSCFANDCFVAKFYWHALYLFDLLMKRDTREKVDWWPAKRTCILEMFRKVLAKQSDDEREDIRKIVFMLGSGGNESQRKAISEVVQQWKENHLSFSSEVLKKYTKP